MTGFLYKARAQPTTSITQKKKDKAKNYTLSCEIAKMIWPIKRLAISTQILATDIKQEQLKNVLIKLGLSHQWAWVTSTLELKALIK